ncbi:Uncharacterised protein [Mycobacterium tuberculosis]|uniref:Uncharacterized protein n=1 Tax=Mycobacterium tuberculosis TaxID=1773 RepID=A0A916L8K2_MYCTX|nr:Uncharacterised protein [Mycobacterium tuberculosis]COX11620.1 Uncharacterised protein [Mycobacterium tuberculosis]
MVLPVSAAGSARAAMKLTPSIGFCGIPLTVPGGVMPNRS